MKNACSLRILVILTALISSRAQATLGAHPTGKIVTVNVQNSDDQISGGNLSASSIQKPYKLYTSTASNGSTIREYVSNKIVFAVSWSGGRTHPDLNPLLGSEYSQYQKGLENHPKKKGRAAHHVESEDLVVIKSGHMFDNKGLAYKKSLLPAGVSPADLH